MNYQCLDKRSHLLSRILSPAAFCRHLSIPLRKELGTPTESCPTHHNSNLTHTMKKTLIALMALAGVAAAEDWTATFTTSNTSKNQTYTDYSAAFAEGSPLTLSITNIVITGDGTTSNYNTSEGNHPSSIRPNTNVGNGGTWTLSFSLTNTSTEAITLQQIAFDVFTFNSSGAVQGKNTARNLTLTLTGDATGSVSFTHGGSNISGDVASRTITLNSGAVTISAGDSLSLSLTASPQEDSGGGTFLGLTGATFSGEIVTPVIPDTPAVPEPATATLSLLALAGLAARRRRK